MGKIHHSSLKACSHSCARHNFFPTRCLAVVVENKFHHSWLRHSWCNLFFPPRLLSHSWGKICDLHRNGNMPFVTHGVFSIHSLGASPLVSVFSHPYFSSVGDWLTVERVLRENGCNLCLALQKVNVSKCSKWAL